MNGSAACPTFRRRGGIRRHQGFSRLRALCNAVARQALCLFGLNLGCSAICELLLVSPAQELGGLQQRLDTDRHADFRRMRFGENLCQQCCVLGVCIEMYRVACTRRSGSCSRRLRRRRACSSYSKACCMSSKRNYVYGRSALFAKAFNAWKLLDAQNDGRCAALWVCEQITVVLLRTWLLRGKPCTRPRRKEQDLLKAVGRS